MPRRHPRPERLERLERTLSRIREVLPSRADELSLKRIVLFGSVGRGTHDDRSDVDLIVVQRTVEPFVRRGVEILLAIDPEVGVDLLVYTPEEWSSMQVHNKFIRRAIAEGEVVYAQER